MRKYLHHVLTFTLAVALVGGVAAHFFKPDPNPLCEVIQSIEADATCQPIESDTGPKYQAKVGMPDTSEAYCSIEKKAGLVCRPIKAPPQAPAQPAPAATAPAPVTPPPTATGSASFTPATGKTAEPPKKK